MLILGNRGMGEHWGSLNSLCGTHSISGMRYFNEVLCMYGARVMVCTKVDITSPPSISRFNSVGATRSVCVCSIISIAR